jgi:hypothetical protein
MWMGGNVPLGYDVKDRKLIINEAEAATVRLIFRRYAELGSVALLKAELDRLGIVSKRREGAGGALSGGKRFSRYGPSITMVAFLRRKIVASCAQRREVSLWPSLGPSESSILIRCTLSLAITRSNITRALRARPGHREGLERGIMGFLKESCALRAPTLER